VDRLKDKIKELILLQDCDNKIKEINIKKKGAPLRLQDLKKELDEMEMLLKAKKDRLESIKKDRRAMEQGVQDLESRMEKSRIKLSNIKSNKEYTAVLKEIEDQEKEKSLNEDNLLHLMDEIEVLDKNLMEGNSELAGLKDQYARTMEEVEKEIKELDERMKALEQKRMMFCDSIDKDLLKRYLLLQGRKGGIAIGSVIGGVCQSCHMGIPPQQFNELIKCDSLTTCPNCNRMVYWGEDIYFLKVLEEIRNPS
jgi:predicted  nucleic acid-binding Zn-ribbon protein